MQYYCLTIVSKCNTTIVSYQSKETEKIFNGEVSRDYPGDIQRTALRKLSIIDAATSIRLSVDIGVAQTRISEIINGKRGISADTAIRLSRYFSNSAQFWLNLQAGYDLRLAQAENQAVYVREASPLANRIPTASGVN